MKKQNTANRLKLNKQTIAGLNKKALSEIKGGSWYTITTITDLSKDTICTSDAK